MEPCMHPWSTHIGVLSFCNAITKHGGARSIMLSATKSNSVEEEAAAAVIQVAEEEEGEEAYVGAAAQDADAVADVEEADGVAAAADGPTVMSWTEYVVAYKRLSESEINYFLSRPRKPFESTPLYKDMVTDSSTTKEDLEREAADHEYAEDALSETQGRVRREYADKGFVAVDDDMIAERLELEQHFKETWAAMFDELGLDHSMFAEE
ncbi:hypothetical protein BDA96_10G338300 [Sorghum bicolor]|uniref:Uncharacterized protein n=1 Tax=Sorghum bicolor TaxID=4558 RepID=A0A921Q5U5_SORBI|nr:hypothetical protein BDA96_10G338300 [Sorghum bicolor]